MDKCKRKSTLKKWLAPIDLRKLRIELKQAIKSFDFSHEIARVSILLKGLLWTILDDKDILRHIAQGLVCPELKNLLRLG